MLNLNEAYENELYFQYLKDAESVSPEWRKYFKDKEAEKIDFESAEQPSSKEAKREKEVKEDDKIYIDEEAKVEPLPRISSLISENMEESLEVPTATSAREIPVKAMDENRRIINNYLRKMKRSKISFTHILAWALVRALIKYPGMNYAYTIKDGKPHIVKRKSINLGLAVDITKKDGSRLLLVPNIKDAQQYNFSEFIVAFDEIIYKTKNNKLDIDDLSGTTISLTNPGMIGTTASNPRLMKGQGLIVATGAIGYPSEFQAVKPEIMANFAVSKIFTVTSTYDHRIIQGAQSAEFLQYINKLLIGEDMFYDQIFAALKIPFEPARWRLDKSKVNITGEFDEQERIEKAAHAMMMINAYRVRGHLLADINPLGFQSYYYPELDPAFYGFTIWDLDRIFHASDIWENNNIPLREILEKLRETYCGSIGIEFMHIQAPETKLWIQRKLETGRDENEFKQSDKVRTLRLLIEAELFENFLHTKFIGHKRFSLEGSETIVALIDKLFEKAADRNLKAVFMGMPHRGRLNVLTHLFGKSPAAIFREFEENIDSESYQGSGDVKYHLGHSGVYVSPSNNSIPVKLASNPSHLELVDPVVEGMARAEDDRIGDDKYIKSLPVLVHGDSAFSGQGVVAETLNLSQLDAYKTGGTIHVIVNNQIGFTTTSEEARSSVYCTDVAKMIQSPILHVNGNDPEAVINAADFAYDYREKFHTDIVIDVLSYRKYGHNEADEPSYTQPLLYKKIESMIQISKIYAKELIQEEVVSAAEVDKLYEEEKNELQKLFDKKEKFTPLSETDETKKEKPKEKINREEFEDNLKKVIDALTTFPKNFHLHKKLEKLIEKRKKALERDKELIDWSLAEALSFGSLLLEGVDIRLSGQDSKRGTFSQRHSEFVDVLTEETYNPLNDIEEGQAEYRIHDSSLSELAVLGFEYGYSVIAEDSLTLWEAQFGDFANGAQAITDQFIACAEAKWGQLSNITLLLPHSYDGQGPEHSSARLERFLQLSAEDNMRVCNLTTPAQYFHLLRRQAVTKPRKPLVIMTPKSMLRHPKAVSTLKNLVEGEFKNIIDDPAVAADKASSIKRILMCSGKIYWELMETRKKLKVEDTAIVRVEQLYPFDSKLALKYISEYKNAKEIVWVQEEPKNMGAWSFIAPRLREMARQNQKVEYVGRDESASTATGSLKIHTKKQKEILNKAFGK